MSNLTGIWPYFAEDEIQAVTEVLQSGKVNQWTGPHVKAFEQEFAQYIGVDHAIAMANGTVTLETALRACGVGVGNEVIVSPRTFLATASSVVMCGATPIFADVDLQSQNITAQTIAAKITPRTKAIIPVHLAGWPCEMDEIMSLAEANNLYVIEDCAQAHGAEYKGKKVGAWGHVGSFSFCQDKIMTTGGEGGMVVTNDDTLWKKMWSWKDHGKDYDTVFHTEHPPGFRWLHGDFGTNLRMSAMQAAIGSQQLTKLDHWVAMRRHYAERLKQAFAEFSCIFVPMPGPESVHAFYKFYCFVKPELLARDWNRDRIMQEITQQGIPCFSGSCSEIYLEKCFETQGLQPEQRLSNAKRLGETSLMFMVHPTLSEQDIDQTIAIIQDVLSQAC